MNVPLSLKSGVSDSVECLSGALRYSLSDLRRLLAGGLVVLLSITVIGLPLLLGYVTRCIREAAAGNQRLPAFNRLIFAYADGLKICFLGLEYFLLTVIAFGITLSSLYGAVDGPGTASGSQRVAWDSALAAQNSPLFSMLQLAIFLLLFCSAWMLYALTGRIFTAMNPLAVLEWIAVHPAMILSSAIGTCIIGALLIVPAIPIVTGPWVLFAGLTAFAMVNARTYDRWKRHGDPVIAFVVRSLTGLFRNLQNSALKTVPGMGSATATHQKPLARLRQNLGVASGQVLSYLLSRVEGTIHSLRYAFSDMDLVFWGGVTVLFSYALIGFPLLFGYVSRCLREALKGNRKLPMFDRRWGMLVDRAGRPAAGSTWPVRDRHTLADLRRLRSQRIHSGRSIRKPGRNRGHQKILGGGRASKNPRPQVKMA